MVLTANPDDFIYMLEQISHWKLMKFSVKFRKALHILSKIALDVEKSELLELELLFTSFLVNVLTLSVPEQLKIRKLPAVK